MDSNAAPFLCRIIRHVQTCQIAATRKECCTAIPIQDPAIVVAQTRVDRCVNGSELRQGIFCISRAVGDNGKEKKWEKREREREAVNFIFAPNVAPSLGLLDTFSPTLLIQPYPHSFRRASIL